MEELKKEVIEHFVQASRGQGITDDAIAKIMGHLYIEPEEVALEDLSKETGYSLSTISNKIKFLEISGMVKKSRKPGTKKVYAYMDKDFLGHSERILKLKRKAVFGLAKKNVPELIKKFKDKAKTDKQKERLKILKNYMHQVEILDKSFEKMLKFIEEEKNACKVKKGR
jgi:DNA-binding transcriptional regulator GbsR (MarR family)